MNRQANFLLRYKQTSEFEITEPGSTLSKRVAVVDGEGVFPLHHGDTIRPVDLQAINEHYRSDHAEAVTFCEAHDIDPDEELSDPPVYTVQDVGTREELDTARA